MSPTAPSENLGRFQELVTEFSELVSPEQYQRKSYRKILAIVEEIRTILAESSLADITNPLFYESVLTLHNEVVDFFYSGQSIRAELEGQIMVLLSEIGKKILENVLGGKSAFALSLSAFLALSSGEKELVNQRAVGELRKELRAFFEERPELPWIIFCRRAVNGPIETLVEGRGLEPSREKIDAVSQEEGIACFLAVNN